MPDLQHTLRGHDLGFFNMVANAWRLEFSAPDARAALPLLQRSLLDAKLLNEVVAALPSEARSALQTLHENDGRLPWPVFARRFGEVRQMGAARRDRERPDLTPVSPAEVLWYRALIGKAMLGNASEPQEYAFIPDDLLELLEPPPGLKPQPLGRPATSQECAHPLPVNDHILEHACTLLAALRLKMARPDFETSLPDEIYPSLPPLLASAGLLDADQLPVPEPTRALLAAPRGQALAMLVKAWLDSPSFNELRLIPGLVCEGEWSNDPLKTRHQVIDWLSQLPLKNWWSLNAFVSAVRDHQPDYQRPAGDYDSWFIRREDSETFLRGFSTWDEVDGALLRFMITGPMHWLGLVDLASSAPDGRPSAFRFSAWAETLLNGQPPAGLKNEAEKMITSADGFLKVPQLAPRALRYQIARFSQWEGLKREEYRYRLTPSSLARARKQGLKASQLITLLQRHSTTPLPPTLRQAIERWEKFGSQARLEEIHVLRVEKAEILTALRQTRALRFLTEELNPTTVIIKPGGEAIVLKALAETGYLAEASLEA
jgi:hypothetical protein